MKQTIILFIAGILLALLGVGGYFATQSYFVSADADIIPEDIVIERVSPTIGSVKFTTIKPSIASIECASSIEGPYSLCGAETSLADNHDIRTSIILDPAVEYYFFIKIKNVTFDNIGNPFVIPIKKNENKDEFPTKLFGVCSSDDEFDETFDLNKDGCIRQNDRMLYIQ